VNYPLFIIYIYIIFIQSGAMDKDNTDEHVQWLKNVQDSDEQLIFLNCHLSSVPVPSIPKGLVTQIWSYQILLSCPHVGQMRIFWSDVHPHWLQRVRLFSY